MTTTATSNGNLCPIRRMAVCEVGPRDGLQIEKTALSIEQKVDLIERSAAAGARFIEVGSMVHPKAVPQMADTDEVAKRIRKVDGVEYRVLVMNVKGIERAVDVRAERPGAVGRVDLVKPGRRAPILLAAAPLDRVVPGVGAGHESSQDPGGSEHRPVYLARTTQGDGRQIPAS